VTFLWLQPTEITAKADACDCHLDLAAPGNRDGPAFYMCPTHAGGPVMLETLKQVKAHLDYITQETRRKWTVHDQRTYEIVVKAIARAEGRNT